VRPRYFGRDVRVLFLATTVLVPCCFRHPDLNNVRCSTYDCPAGFVCLNPPNGLCVRAIDSGPTMDVAVFQDVATTVSSEGGIPDLAYAERAEGDTAALDIHGSSDAWVLDVSLDGGPIATMDASDVGPPDGPGDGGDGVGNGAGGGGGGRGSGDTIASGGFSGGGGSGSGGARIWDANELRIDSADAQVIDSFDAPIALGDTADNWGRGGASGSAGLAGTGGTGATGGMVGTSGGVGAGGIGSTGGMPGAGGTVGSGGLAGTGGVASTGGALGTGGMVGTGGTVGTGGDLGAGGVIAAGGGTGTGGAGGSGGSSAPIVPADIVPDLDGFYWEGTCSGDLSVSGKNGPLLDNGGTTCPSGTSWANRGTIRTITKVVQGSQGTQYTINFEVRGVVGARCYMGGAPATTAPSTATGQNNWWYVGGSPDTNGDIWNTYELHVDPPVSGQANVYYFNSAQPSPTWCQKEATYEVKYSASFKVLGGGTMRFIIHDSNCQAQQNCGSNEASTTCDSPRSSIDLSGMSPAATFSQPPTNVVGTKTYYPQWLYFDVTSVTSP
jgi:hypothetical protein